MHSALIDTHIHTWDFDRVEYSWLKDNQTILNRTYHLTELEPARLRVGVSQGILVQAANNLEDMDWMLEVAQRTDWISGVVGWLPLMDPQTTGKLLNDRYLSNSHLKGIRHLVHDEPDPQWLLQQPVLESLRLLADHDLVYDMVAVMPKHIETAIAVAEKVPGLRIIFDHLSQPPIAANHGFDEWGPLMKAASGHKNFYAKISGLGITSKNFEGWNANDIRPYVEFVLDHFGVERCMLGSDWPLCLLAQGYEKSWGYYLETLHSLLDADGIEKVRALNATVFYNLEEKMNH